MKFNLSKLSLTILATVTLAACGSSGDSNTQPVNQIKPTEQVKPAEPVKPAEQPKNEEQIVLSRVGFEVNKENRVVTTIERQIHDNNNVNLVNVEGQEIEIIPSGYYERPGFIGINAKELLEEFSPKSQRSVSGKNYKNIRWGTFTDPSLNSYYHVAFGVNPTTEMPQSGIVNYTGYGSHLEAAKKEEYFLSSARLTANFADKTLNGTISLAKTGFNDVLVSNDIAGGALSPEIHFDDISLSAKIQGNQFSGTSEKGVHTEGGFYGKDAEEVAGTYKGKDAMGVFGARKN